MAYICVHGIIIRVNYLTKLKMKRLNFRLHRAAERENLIRQGDSLFKARSQPEERNMSRQVNVDRQREPELIALCNALRSYYTAHFFRKRDL